MDELQNQFDYYIENQESIVEKYNGRWIVIAEKQVVGDFDSQLAAYEFAISKFEPGNFMIQNVAPGEENYTQTFNSRVAF